MRDKLIELICESEKRWRYPVGNSYLFDYGKLADYLISHGVTFAEDNNVGGKRNIRPIDAYTLAEEIESLQITVGGKPAHWYDAKHTVLRMIAEQPDVPETNVGKWIPVSERLPEKNCKCLVCVDVDVWGKEYKAIAVEQYNEDWLGWYSDGRKIPNITHWMPLPEPPKEGE